MALFVVLTTARVAPFDGTYMGTRQRLPDHAEAAPFTTVRAVLPGGAVRKPATARGES